ncbi:MAG: TRAP transporter substrate-binding protein [Candidatus Eremiobacteraeota bacterium]|nr:TRAP transporter substrate-binding protein [Candidatus Eremiobacteraeota bacterium]
MSNVTRARFALGTAAAFASVGIARFPANAAEFSLKYANNLPLTHPMNVRAQEAADKIKAESGGRVEITIFPNNALGGDGSMLTQVRAGAIAFYTNSGLNLSALTQACGINCIGFAFPTYKDVWTAMDGDLGAHVRGALEGVGLHAFDRMWDNGFREITTSTGPINTPKDLNGFKIRVPVSPLSTSLFKALDASPVGIDFSNVYTSLQTKLVSGQENPLVVIETVKLYEVQKYCSLTNHIWDGFWFLAHGETWNKLPKNIQEIIARNIDAAAEKDRNDVKSLNTSLASKLKSQGLAMNAPATGPFRDALGRAGYYKDWKKTFGDTGWAALEKYTGKLG